jgi:hypothetical protein
MRLEQADLQRLAFEQRSAGDFHGPIPASHEAGANNGLLVVPKHTRARGALPIEVASSAFSKIRQLSGRSGGETTFRPSAL